MKYDVLDNNYYKIGSVEIDDDCDYDIITYRSKLYNYSSGGFYREFNPVEIAIEYNAEYKKRTTGL